MRNQLIKIFAAVAVLLTAASVGFGAVYYVNGEAGNDDNAGTNSLAPLRTLPQVNALKLRSGDHVLFARGQTFTGQLAYDNLAGTEAQPIVISSYMPEGKTRVNEAVIDAKGFVAGVFLKNCTHVEIADLSIIANGGGMQSGQRVRDDRRCGVLVMTDAQGSYAGITLSNLTVHDVFYEAPGFVRDPEEVRSANGTQNYGWGIRFVNTVSGAVLRDIIIRDCRIDNIEHTGIKLTSPSNGLQNVIVQRIRITRTGGPGVQMSGVCGGHFSELDVEGSGSKDDSRKWGRGSGLWTWGSSDVVIEKSRFQNANGPGDSAGVHIDYNCRNVIVQYNFSAHNAGGFCEILGNNYNCGYRYNVSVNDGYRMKGKDGAFQEGKILWLSGYTGDKSPQEGPFYTYFYNNTIYVDATMVAKISIAPTARGVLIANNIFCIEGQSEQVSGDQPKADKLLRTPLQGVIFANNLFLHQSTWPSKFLIANKPSFQGDPCFRKPGGSTLEDYAPCNANLVKDRGIPISLIPGDNIGLRGGLKMEFDILGHSIVGNPDLGAEEIVRQENPKIGLR